jgi:hypothetical protein
MVKRLLIAALIALPLAGFVRPVFAQSLGDIAKKEEERRKAIKTPAPVLTNKDLGAVPPAPPPSSSSATGATAAAPAATADKDSAADAGPVKDQAYWSGKVKELLTQIDRDQAYAAAMQVRVNSLTTDFTNRDDPAQRAAIDQDRKRTIAELDRLTLSIQKDKKAFADLQEDARKAGVPPGWLR